jgi:hypothetical protein
MKDHPMYKEPQDGVWEYLDAIVALKHQYEYARLRRRKTKKHKIETTLDKVHHAGLARRATKKHSYRRG